MYVRMSPDGVTVAVLHRFRFLFRDFLLSKFFTMEMYIYAFRDCWMRHRCVVRRCMDVMVGRNGVGYDVRQWQVFGVTG